MVSIRLSWPTTVTIQWEMQSRSHLIACHGRTEEPIEYRNAAELFRLVQIRLSRISLRRLATGETAMNSNRIRNRTGPQVDRTDRDPQLSKATRYATVLLIPGPDGFHPGDKALREEPSITQESIPHITLLNDGTVIMMYQLRGDLERAKELLDASPVAISCGVAGTDRGLVYVHSGAVDPGKSLLLVPHQYKIILDTPLEYTSDGDLRVTLIGDAKPLQRALAELADSFEVRLEETGEYQPGLRDFTSLLTDRQCQILRVAVEQGYYEVPRQATIRDIADVVRLSQATVGEHLQKVEATVLSRIVR